MLTTKGRALYTYLEHNASKEQINGIILFFALVTGIRFSISNGLWISRVLAHSKKFSDLRRLT